MADPIESNGMQEMRRWAGAAARAAFIFAMIVSILLAGIVVHKVYELGRTRGHLEALLPGYCQ
jgi:hypothetical protein